jgi:hypothetical protein
MGNADENAVGNDVGNDSGYTIVKALAKITISSFR